MRNSRVNLLPEPRHGESLMILAGSSQTVPFLEVSTMKTHWAIHPLVLLFPPMTAEERATLKKDMLDRVARGLEPLETPILLWSNQILDGRHRDEVWIELAEEDAGGGFFKGMRPPTEDFAPEKYGTLGAWMRVNIVDPENWTTS